MKKVFTLLTLALLSIGTAWAAGPSDPTIANLTAKSFTSTELLWTTPSNATTWYNAGWVVGGKSSSRGSFTSVTNKKYNMNPENDETVSATAFEGLGIKKDSDTKTVYFCVTNVTAVDIYVISNGSSERTARMVISNSTNSTKITKTGAAAANSSAKISATGLDAGYTYLIKVDETGGSDMTLYAVRFTAPVAKTATSEILKSSAAVKVGDTALTKDAATNGYSVDGTTITLSDDIDALSAPSNVKLVKTTTYDDESTEDADVAVTFDGTITSGYFIGTASIGLTGSVTNYSVRVKKNVTPTATLSATSGSISIANSYTVIGSTKVTLTGGNLTDGTYDVTTDEAGTTISPATFTVASGSVSQEFTITSSAASAATTVFTFGSLSMGVAAPTFTLTYSKTAQRSLSQSNVSATTTWDWSKAGGNTIQLNASTTPAKEEEFLLAKLTEITNDANFNSQALVGACEYPNRNGYFQGPTLKFTTTVPGVIDVDFSNTGGSRPYRYLNVNGKNTSFKENAGSKTSATNINVPSGEVTLQGMFVDDASQFYLKAEDSKYYIKSGNGTDADFKLGDVNQYGVAQYIRIYKVVFTANVEAVGTKAERNYATYVTTNKLDFGSASGITAYIATGLNGEGDAVVLKEVNVVPAGTPIIVNTTSQGATVKVPVTDADADDVSENKLVAGDGVKAYNNEGNSYYYLASDQFHLANAGILQSGKAYLEVAGATAPQLSIVFGDSQTTGINAVNGEGLKVQGSEVYNLNGQRVLNPTKGLYIVNGRKVVIK